MTTWTAEQDQTLTDLWVNSGLSTSRIASEIGGFTKNAIIGRARRIGLPQRRPGGTPSTKCARRVRSAMAAARSAAMKPLTPLGGSRMGPPPMRELPMPPPLPTAFDAERRAFGLVHLLDLEPHHCRFAIGYDDKLGHGFCGCNAVPGLPYCEHHAGRVYTPMEREAPSRRGESKLAVADKTYAATLQEFLQPA